MGLYEDNQFFPILEIIIHTSHRKESNPLFFRMWLYRSNKKLLVYFANVL